MSRLPHPNTPGLGATRILFHVDTLQNNRNQTFTERT